MKIGSITVAVIDSDRVRRRRISEILQSITSIRTVKSVGSVADLLENIKEGTEYEFVILGNDGNFEQRESLEALRNSEAKTPPAIVYIPAAKLGTPLVPMLYEAGAVAFISDPLTVDGVNEAISKVAESESMRSYKDRSSESSMRIALRFATHLIDDRAMAQRAGKEVPFQAKKEWKELKTWLAEKQPGVDEETYLKTLQTELDLAKPFEQIERAQSKVKKKIKHPAIIVKAFMKQRNLTDERFLELMKVDAEMLAEFVQEKIQVNGELAAALSRVVGKDPTYWLNYKG